MAKKGEMQRAPNPSSGHHLALPESPLLSFHVFDFALLSLSSNPDRHASDFEEFAPPEQCGAGQSWRTCLESRRDAGETDDM